MPLSPEQAAEIEAQRADSHTTRRATVAALEEVLFTAVPVLDHGQVRTARQARRWLEQRGGLRTIRYPAYCACEQNRYYLWPACRALYEPQGASKRAKSSAHR